ncbi:MAG: phospholipase D-like domain-containing protein, partial [Candidatus Bipolaricaulaceae bacterium]
MRILVVLSVAFVIWPNVAAFSQRCAVEAVFLPPLIEARLLNLLENAAYAIDVAVHILADEHLIDALIQAHQRGVAVRVILGEAITKAHEKLQAHGIPVLVLEGTPERMQHRFAVIDDFIVVTGSFVWSEHVHNNFENVVVIKCSEIAEKFVKEFERIWTAYAYKAYDFTLPATLTVNVPLTRTGTAEVTLTPPKDKILPAGDITFSIKE